MTTYSRNTSQDAEFDGSRISRSWSLGDCEVTDAGCQVIVDIVKMNDPFEELDLPMNTKSSKTCKITIDESSAGVDKAKTTIGGEAVRDHQEHRAEKESDRPAEDPSGEQARGNSIQSQHI